MVGSDANYSKTIGSDRSFNEKISLKKVVFSGTGDGSMVRVLAVPAQGPEFGIEALM